MGLYNIPESMKQSILAQVTRQNSLMAVSSVGEALRFQDMIA